MSNSGDWIDRAKDRISELGITQAEVAKRMGCTKSWVTQLFDRERAAYPRRETLETLSKALEMTVDDLQGV